MIQKTEGVVLRSLRFQDSSLIVSLYTREFGRMDFLAKGVLSVRSQKKHAYFQTLNILDCVFYQKENRDLQTLSESAIHYPYQSLPIHPVKRMYGMLLGEAFYKVIREEEPNPPLYDFLKTALMGLDQLSGGYYPFTAHTLLHLTRFAGFFPMNQNLNPSLPLAFSPREAAFSQSPVQDDLVARQLYLYSRATRQSCFDIETPQPLRKSVLEAIFELYAYHVENFSPINTLRVFESVFS